MSDITAKQLIRALSPEDRLKVVKMLELAQYEIGLCVDQHPSGAWYDSLIKVVNNNL